MIKHYCDFCKKEIIGKANVYTINVTRLDEESYSKLEIDDQDICLHCLGEIRKVLSLDRREN